MDIKELIGQHGKSVALVFKKMGIKAAVTPANVMLMTGLYKDRFIDAVVEQVDQDEHLYSGWGEDGFTPGLADAIKIRQQQVTGGFNAPKTLPNVTVTAKKKKSGAVKNTLMDLVSVFATGYGAYKNARATANTSNTGSDPIITGDGSYPPPAEPKKKPNVWLIGGIVVIVALILVIVFSSKKK